MDGITNEQLKFGEAALISHSQLERLFERVWEEEVIPEDWLKGVIIVIGKKGDTSYCGNNRGIILRATVSKLLAQMILLRRMNVGMECLLRENQCGFRQNRSCIDQINSLRTIINNCIEFNIPLYIKIADFKAAFDSIRKNFILASMRHYEIMGYLKCMLGYFRRPSMGL